MPFIVSDIKISGMSGLELSLKVKALRPGVPVIMITAYGDAETRRKAVENGAEALLTDRTNRLRNAPQRNRRAG